MKNLAFRRSTFGVSVAAALLAACGAPGATPQSDFVGAPYTGSKNHKNFSYAGKEQTFVVPSGVTRLTVIARGAEGAGSSGGSPSADWPGFPGRVYAIVRVQPGEKLYVFVGGSGDYGSFNGGGSAGANGNGKGGGYPGGGASDVRAGSDALKDRIIVAAGGGGAGSGPGPYIDAYGGNGGGLVGRSGDGGGSSYCTGGGGGGGSQSKGGAGGAAGSGSGIGKNGGNGALGRGGDGGNGASDSTYDFGGGGGGGGGGYYGGGGGGGAGSVAQSYWECDGGGGGGGSSYIEANAIYAHTWTGWREAGNGHVNFTWN